MGTMNFEREWGPVIGYFSHPMVSGTPPGRRRSWVPFRSEIREFDLKYSPRFQSGFSRNPSRDPSGIMGIAVARQAGLPSVLVENFTWDWIWRVPELLNLPSVPKREPNGAEQVADFVLEQWERL